jgi:spermidine synthase
MRKLCLLAVIAFLPLLQSEARVVFQTTSAHHNIRVVDTQGIRFLSFDGSMETRMSLADPTQGHFEYTEFFHMPFLWNSGMSNVLMIGLGGASTQRAFQRYYPAVKVETVELDPVVVKVARDYFHFQESPTNKVIVSDGRLYIRRTEQQYDAIMLDAYVKSRYGSYVPHHMATKEFFELVNQRLTTNGVVAYNMIGTLHGQRADILGAVYRTMKTVFPQVYLFPASDSQNVVLIATKSPHKMTALEAWQKGYELVLTRKVTMPAFLTRVRSFWADPPASFLRSPVLTDDFSPVDGLLRGRN